MSPNTDLSYAALNASTDEADLTFAGRAFHGFTTRLLKKLDLKANFGILDERLGGRAPGYTGAAIRGALKYVRVRPVILFIEYFPSLSLSYHL